MTSDAPVQEPAPSTAPIGILLLWIGTLVLAALPLGFIALLRFWSTSPVFVVFAVFFLEPVLWWYAAHRLQPQRRRTNLAILVVGFVTRTIFLAMLIDAIRNFT